MALGVWYGFLGTVSVLPRVDVLPFPTGLARVFNLALLTNPTVVWLSIALVTVSLVAWTFERWTAGSTLVAFALTVCFAHAEGSLLANAQSVTHGKMMPFAVLVAYELGRVAMPLRPHVAGIEAASGVVAGSYFLGGLAKLRAGGLSWVDGPALSLMAAERAEGSVLAGLRWAVASAPVVAGVMLALSLALELGALLFLWPRHRLIVAVLLLGMHLSIGLILSYFHFDWALTTVAVAWMSWQAGRGLPALPERLTEQAQPPGTPRP